MTTSQPDDPQPRKKRVSRRRRVGDATTPQGIPPLNVTFHMHTLWPLQLGWNPEHVLVDVCSMTPASQSGPEGVECFDMQAPSGSQPIEVRMSGLVAAMLLATKDDQPKLAHFSVVKSPIRPAGGEGPLNYPCFIADAPKRGKLVWVDTVAMFAVFMHEGDEAVELDPPKRPRFIAVPPRKPAPKNFLHLGVVNVDGEWFRLYCPDLHIPPIEMHWQDKEPTTAPDGQDTSAGPEEPPHA